MKVKRLICAASLAASTILATSAYAEYDAFDLENFPNSSDAEAITFSNEDIEWAVEDESQQQLKHIPNPIHAPPPVVEAQTCELDWPHDEMGMQVAFHRQGESDNNKHLQYFRITNQNEFDIKVTGAEWARSLVFQLDNHILNWRHADSYEEAHESDRRIIQGFWVQEPFQKSQQVNDTKPAKIYHDHPNALVMAFNIENENKSFSKEEVFTVPADPNGFVHEMIMKINDGAWEDSHYRLDAQLFCLDEHFDSAVGSDADSDGGLAPQPLDVPDDD